MWAKNHNNNNNIKKQQPVVLLSIFILFSNNNFEYCMLYAGDFIAYYQSIEPIPLTDKSTCKPNTAWAKIIKNFVWFSFLLIWKEKKKIFE